MTPVAADSAPLPAAAAPARVSLRDFSDRLSPMLVKELRQGLKSHIFTWGLIAMQVALIVVALLSMEVESGRGINAIFFWSIALPVCVLLPMRVANALREETSANTLDTLLLTQLSAWRITLGKWLATCALQILVAVTALPYLILRYFAGGVNTPLEMAWLGLFVLFGMVVTSVMLGLSWFPHFLVRAIIMLGILFGAVAACAGVIHEISRGDYGLDEVYREISWPGVIYILVLAGYVAFYCLDLGAARLAPLSENRATRRRLMGLFVLIVCGGCCGVLWYWASSAAAIASVGPGRGSSLDPEMPVALAGMLGAAMLLPVIQALCERPVNLAPVLMPFMKRGWRGRLAGRLFLPGWHSGIFLMLVLIAAVGGFAFWMLKDYMASRHFHSDPDFEIVNRIWQVSAGILGTLVMPVVVWNWTRRMNRWDFWRWLLLIIAAVAFHFFVTALGSKSAPKMTWANYLIPSGAFLVEPSSEAQVRARLDESEPPEENTRKHSPRERFLQGERRERERRLIRESLYRQHGIVASISCVLWLGLALWLACREMRVTHRAWRDHLA